MDTVYPAFGRSTGTVMWRGKGAQGRSKKMDEEGLVTLSEKCIGIEFEAQPVGFVDELMRVWNVRG